MINPSVKRCVIANEDQLLFHDGNPSAFSNTSDMTQWMC